MIIQWWSWVLVNRELFVYFNQSGIKLWIFNMCRSNLSAVTVKTKLPEIRFARRCSVKPLTRITNERPVYYWCAGVFRQHIIFQRAGILKRRDEECVKAKETPGSSGKLNETSSSMILWSDFINARLWILLLYCCETQIIEDRYVGERI